MAADLACGALDHGTIPAIQAELGRFYRTSGGRLVLVTEKSSGSGRVRVRYKGLYGLGWQTMWLPAESPLVPAPEVSSFSENEISTRGLAELEKQP